MRDQLRAIMIIFNFALVSACAPDIAELSRSELRDLVVQRGPEHVIATLEQYPRLDSDTVRTWGDFQFLLEIVRGTVESPKWLATGLPTYERARAIASNYLANDHGNQHFRLPPADVAALLDYGRRKIAQSSENREQFIDGIRIVGALGTESDIELLTSAVSRSAQTSELETGVLTLALMCYPRAETAMLGILEARRELLTPKFRELAVKVREKKQLGLCAQ